jgi:hypothetical protein
MRAVESITRMLEATARTATAARILDISKSSHGITMLFENRSPLRSIAHLSVGALARMGLAIREFHNAGRKIVRDIQRIPWFHLTEEMEGALRRASRWKPASMLLEEMKAGALFAERLVASHNDVHAGNVFYAAENILFLDIDDMCRADFRNDLGMALNSFTRYDITTSIIRNRAAALLRGYGISPSSEHVRIMAAYAVRKAILTEAYFLFMRQRYAGAYTEADLATIRRRQITFRAIAISLD